MGVSRRPVWAEGTKFDHKLFRSFELKEKQDRTEGQISTVCIKPQAHVSPASNWNLQHGISWALLAFHQKTKYNIILKNPAHPGTLPRRGSPPSPSSWCQHNTPCLYATLKASNTAEPRSRRPPGRAEAPPGPRLAGSDTAADFCSSALQLPSRGWAHPGTGVEPWPSSQPSGGTLPGSAPLVFSSCGEMGSQCASVISQSIWGSLAIPRVCFFF